MRDCFDVQSLKALILYNYAILVFLFMKVVEKKIVGAFSANSHFCRFSILHSWHTIVNLLKAESKLLPFENAITM